MLHYTEDQLKITIQKLLKKKVSVKAVGNHELKRHLVYKATDEMNDSVMVKLYYKKNRWNREVASLKLLSGSDIKCPKLLEYGVLNDGTEWMVSECIDGEPFDKVQEMISRKNQLIIMEEMGKELKKIHSLKRFNFFGNWDENGISVEKRNEYRLVFTKRSEVTLQNLFQQHLPEEALQRKAAEKLRKRYGILDNINQSRLCHNDFDGRNILVKNNRGKWKLAAVIDFEQSLPWDKDNDLAILYQKYFLNNELFKESFFKGYNNYKKTEGDLTDKMNFYLLYIGLEICSWAYENAPDYYKQGVKLLESLV